MGERININTKNQAVFGDNAPDAMGLFFLIGCCLSLGASNISFKKYAPEERIQNEVKA
jgi:hypothetical protein